MSTKKSSESVKHSEPIPIAASRAGRQRSGSVSSASSGSSPELQTPTSENNSQRILIPSPGTSPILSYFLAQSPNAKSPGSSTFPFRKFTAPVLEEDDQAAEPPSAFHARRASTVVAGRFGQQQPQLPEPQLERGAGLLRRLSLSSGFTKPDLQSFRPSSPPGAPPNSAVSPVASNMPFSRDSKPRRSATISAPRRAPSPMGERILKGHFDGFN
ncbi:hypothetical protein C8J56DRAFT_1160393 [Mycena floridula]|nr:hypothetical protein C8J56DRAFT_1160393 [Mycena floridula]